MWEIILKFLVARAMGKVMARHTGAAGTVGALSGQNKQDSSYGNILSNALDTSQPMSVNNTSTNAGSFYGM